LNRQPVAKIGKMASMAKLIYTSLLSLDGYISDKDGKFDWAFPDEEVHRFVNDFDRATGTYLYGRHMYETMHVWETDPSLAEMSPFTRDYAEIWKAADKVVYSKTLENVSTTKTRIERNFDPLALKQLKADAGRDLGIGGAELAGQVFKAGLVDEVRLILCPVVVGGGKRALPDEVRLQLELLEERRFANGMVYLHYRVA
jgi:dihydrofolate reductase